jgi:tRNA modification GTPase
MTHKGLIEDTIAAPATPYGVGGIGIIRVSGPEAETIGLNLFRPKRAPSKYISHHLYHGDIIAPETEAVLDEVLFTVMRKPRSYTGEDTVEIHCHGGPAVMDAVLKAVLASGARPAEPGEFTKRAFFNNRLDLSQAEAVIHLIHGKTQRGITLALSHLKGGLSQAVQSLRSTLIDVSSHIEMTIDFTEEEIEPSSPPSLTGMIQQVIDDITGILATYREGKIAGSGLTVVITGKPNVGKSSLLNRMLGEQRAIITPIPGTTRDFIEGNVLIRGIPVTLIDTAGIRNGTDIIEQEGIRLVWEKASTADVIIMLLDGSAELTAEDLEIIERNRGKESLVVINKSDLPQRLDDREVEAIISRKPFHISAKHGDGLAELTERLYGIATKALENDGQSDVVLMNLRHKRAFEKALEHLRNARSALAQGMSPEFSALDIRDALDALGEIIGETTAEDVLERIFSTFCIGK